MKVLYMSGYADDSLTQQGKDSEESFAATCRSRSRRRRC